MKPLDTNAMKTFFKLFAQFEQLIKLRCKTPSLQGGDIKRFCLALLQYCMFNAFQLTYSNHPIHLTQSHYRELPSVLFFETISMGSGK